MNYYPYPYMPNPYLQIQPNNLEAEIIALKKEVKNLKEKIKKIEMKENNKYLKNDEGIYMI